MSRSGYSYDYEHIDLYRRSVENAIRGRRGQRFLRDLATALDAMPIKSLAKNVLAPSTSEVCAIGCVWISRGLQPTEIEDNDTIAEKLGVASSLVAEIEFLNDESHPHFTGEQRWVSMRKWVTENLNEGSQP